MPIRVSQSPWPVILIAITVFLSPSLRAAGAADPTSVAGQWLMLVGTTSTDLSKDEEFNAWYNGIDIPDMLEVPGYERARRGRLESPIQDPDTARDIPPYVALYDIHTRNIDRTIIDELMAAKAMDRRKRSTPLLKVTERVFYRQYSPVAEISRNARRHGSTYEYLERVRCCRDSASETRFNDWYDHTYLPSVIRLPHVVSATRYELYRVLMVYPVDVPEFLTAVELDTNNSAQTAEFMRTILRLRTSTPIRKAFSDTGSALYVMLKDVRRDTPVLGPSKSWQ